MKHPKLCNFINPYFYQPRVEKKRKGEGGKKLGVKKGGGEKDCRLGLFINSADRGNQRTSRPIHLSQLTLAINEKGKREEGFSRERKRGENRPGVLSFLHLFLSLIQHSVERPKKRKKHFYKERGKSKPSLSLLSLFCLRGREKGREDAEKRRGKKIGGG